MNLLEQFLIFDKYRIVRKIKTTHTYTMYIGEHSQTGEYVLIQALNTIAVSRYDSDRGRFLSELKAVRGFDHSNLLRVLESGIVDDTICIVYEYFEGVSLNSYLSEHKTVGVTIALKIVTQVALALRYASDYGILHRSLCASSILIEHKGGNYQIKLYGYGMFFILDYSNLPEIDVDKTYGYMSPEATGVLDRDIDIRSDLYSLGVVFYRLLTGTLPFHAASKDDMVYRHIAEIPLNPIVLDSSIPVEVSNIVTKLLNKDPNLRYSTPNELISDIDRYLCNTEFIPSDRDKDILYDFDRRATIYARSRELSVLKDIYDKTMTSSSGCFCVVHGGLGCGKTDLVTNFCKDISQLDIVCLRSSFKEQYLTTPYHAFQNLFNEYVRLYKGFDHKKQVIEKNRLSKLLGGLTGIITRICPQMELVLSDSKSSPLPDEYKEELRTKQLLSDFILSLFQGDKPYVIVLDDLHNADASSLALLCFLAENVKKYNVMILCSLRDQNENSEDKNNLLTSTMSRISGAEGYTDMLLTAFNSARMCEFLSDLLDLPRQECNVLTTYMLKKTDGNPYFTVNVLRSMLEDSIITVNNGILEQDWDKLRSFNTKHDITDIISSRIELLDENAISLLEIASVIGFDFSLELLAFITDLKISDVMPWIEKAIMMQFINYSSALNILSFSHKQIHDAFSSRLTDTRKRELHYTIAKGIETLYASNLHNEIYRIIYHFIMADYDIGVKKYCIAAADLAYESNANEEAIQYYNRAIELMDKSEIGKPLWVKAKHALTNLSLICGHYDEAVAHASTLIPYMQDDSIKQAKLLKNISLGYFRQSRFSEAVDSLLEALNILGIDNKSKVPMSLQMRRLRFKANHTNYDYTESEDKRKGKDTRGMRTSDGLELEKTVCSIYGIICWIHAFLDKNRMNYFLLKLNEYASEHFQNSPELAFGKSCLSAYYIFNNDRNRFRKTHALASHIRRDLGDRFGTGRSMFLNGLFNQLNDDLPSSVKAFNEAYEIYDKLGDIGECNNINVYLAHSYYLMSDSDNCLTLCERVIDSATKTCDNLALSMAYSVKINMLCKRGHFMYAEQTIRECQELLANLNLPYSECFFELACGNFYLESKRYELAHQHLLKAVDILESNAFVNIMVTTVYSKLAIAKLNILISKRSILHINETTHIQQEIAALCNKAIRISKYNSIALADAYRATALYNSSIQKTKSTNELFIKALELSSTGGDRFENARLHLDYGEFLINRHRTEDARYHLFEASMTFSSIGSKEYAKQSKDLLLNKFSKEISEDSILADVAEKRNRLTTDRKINALLRFGERLTSTLELNELQDKILQDTVEMVGAERGILFLYPESGERKLMISSLYNIDAMDSNAYDWILAQVEKTKQPVIINDVKTDEYKRFYSNLIRFNIKSVMAMPMFVRGKLFGIIYLDSRILRDIFNYEFLETMTFIANQCGAPLENARLYHRAITDGLTGLYGRSYLDNLIIDKTLNPKTAKLSALMLDIDLFKKCNDTYGHQFGDRVLKQVAEIAKRVSAPLGTACRYGGEEFVIIVDSDNVNHALEIGEQIRSTVESTAVPFNEEGKVTLVSITLSIGVTVWNETMERVELVERADKALYYAKHHGKNQVVLWRPDLE